MIQLYSKLWQADSDDWRPGYIFTSLIGLYVLVLPIMMGVGINETKYLYTSIGIIGLTVLSIFSFDIKTCIFYILPLTFLYGHHFTVLGVMTIFLLSYLVHLLRSGKLEIDVPNPRLILLIIVALGISTARAVQFSTAKFTLIFNFILPLAAFLIFYNLNFTYKEIRRFMLPIVIIAAIIGWVSLALWILTGIPRVVFTWAPESQNLGAGFLGLVMPYALINLLDANSKLLKVFWGFLFIGIMSGILTSQTRILLLSTVLAMGYISLTDKRAMRVILVFLLIAMVALPSLIITRFAMLFGKSTEVDWSSVGRVEIWLNSIDYIKQHWLLGMGMDSFRHYWAVDYPNSVVEAQHSHNIFFKWMVDLGIIGFSAYCIFFFRTILQGVFTLTRKVREKFPKDHRLLLVFNASMLMLLAEGMVGSYLKDYRGAILAHIYLAFIAILVRRFNNQTIANN